ncbi:MAG: NAD(P)-binding domain-containing protein, partial [Patescibacteria group bacterium]|nr:NAD(P)-binding domain-containing protein [Patescibacteria group bacterium]
MKKQTVAVIGLGYVGLPLAVRAQERGYNVIGIELDKKKVDLINKQKSPIEEEYLYKNLPKFPIKATPNAKEIKKADIVL